MFNHSTRSTRSLVWVGLSPLLLVASLHAPAARAEGWAELRNQDLQNDTVVWVDILDATTEDFSWSGDGDIYVMDPLGYDMGAYRSGSTIIPTVSGSYRILFDNDQSSYWDLSVNGAGAIGGRVHSYYWHFDTGSYGESDAFNGSLFVKVPGGSSADSSVVEMYADGLSGYEWTMSANPTGIDGYEGLSVDCVSSSCSEFSWDTDYPVYINPPDDATYTHMDPEITDFSFGTGGGSECSRAVPGLSVGQFTFTSNVEGAWHVVCDLNLDGVLDLTDSGDLLLAGDAILGTNTVTWNMTDNFGSYLSRGTYSCQVQLTVGEFHYIAWDVETVYQGLRMYEVDSAGVSTPLTMFWDDADVQALATERMPNGEYSLASPGVLGMDSGDHADAFDANVNARAWGQFDSTSKGNETLLDTYSYLVVGSSDLLDVEIVGATDNSDADTLLDLEEDCSYGTDPTLEDTDDDGVWDDTEVWAGSDPLSDDSDGDTVLDTDETQASNWESGTLSQDSDGDGVLDILDADDDDDLVPTADEDVETVDADPTNDDTDSDGTPNYLDDDDDGDGLLTVDEDVDGDGDPTNDDTDGDGRPNYLDVDSDGDGLTDGEELSGGTDPLVADGDADGLLDGEELAAGTDPAVADTDGDGLSDGDEVHSTGTDPLLADTDGDGLSDGDEVGTVGTDPLVADTDGDGLSDGDEVETTGTDPLLADTDDDDLDDGEEVLSTETDPLVADTDGDGLNDGDELLSVRTDPLLADTDGDDLSDGDEVNVYGSNPHTADTDCDDLNDGAEVQIGTDPTLADTDGGSVEDGQEVANGTDPLDGADDLGAYQGGSCSALGAVPPSPLFALLALFGLVRRRTRRALGVARGA